MLQQKTEASLGRANGCHSVATCVCQVSLGLIIAIILKDFGIQLYCFPHSSNSLVCSPHG